MVQAIHKKNIVIDTNGFEVKRSIIDVTPEQAVERIIQ